MNATQRDTLVAAFGRILPDDDTGPGAGEANVIGFVERAIGAGTHRADLTRVLDNLHLLDSCSEAMTGVPFSRAMPSAQDAVLARLRTAPHPTVLRFLSSLVHLAIMGFLCPPSYGGNEQACGWQYVGYVPHARTRERMHAAR